MISKTLNLIDFALGFVYKLTETIQHKQLTHPPPECVMMLSQLLTGYHEEFAIYLCIPKKIIHNFSPDNIILDKRNHQLNILVDFFLSIQYKELKKLS